MHKTKQIAPNKIEENGELDDDQSCNSSKSREDLIFKEADKVVNLLLDEVVNMSDKKEVPDEEIEEVTLDETCCDID